MAHPPSPSPWEEVIAVQPLRGFRTIDFTPPGGGQAEA